MCYWVIYMSNYFTNLPVGYTKHTRRMFKFGERAANAISFTLGFHLRQCVSLKILRLTFHHVFKNKIVKEKVMSFQTFRRESSFISCTVMI